jgi:hypothetical protein
MLKFIVPLTGAAVVFVVALTAQDNAGPQIDARARYEGKEAIVLGNGRLELTVLPLGGPLASIRLVDGSEGINPLWEAFRADRESGRPIRDNGGTGHFVCVDGFGPVSREEAAAGLRNHGEAHRLPWSTVEAVAEKDEVRLTQTVLLPLVHETFTRTVSLRTGENVVRVQSEAESLLSFDRPMVWAEHGTIGSPFLEPGQTVVDLSPNRAMTRPRPDADGSRRHRLRGGEEFDWPSAPTADGGRADLRAAPENPNSLDHTGHLMTPSGERAWVTALHKGKGLLLGYLFKTSEYPWLQTWEHYPPEGMMARGLEFGTQPFDRPRREMITQNRLFGELMYRWLPARSKAGSTFLMFWTAVPEGFQGVDELVLDKGRIVITDKRSGKTFSLETRQTL